MRGQDNQQPDMFSPLIARTKGASLSTHCWAIRAMAELALWSMSSRFDEMYSHSGRPLILPEKLPHASCCKCWGTQRTASDGEESITA